MISEYTKFVVGAEDEIQTLELSTVRVNDEGLFQINSNLPMNEEFLSIALFDEPVRNIAMELIIVEVQGMEVIFPMTEIEFTWAVTDVGERHIQF